MHIIVVHSCLHIIVHAIWNIFRFMVHIVTMYDSLTYQSILNPVLVIIAEYSSQVCGDIGTLQLIQQTLLVIQILNLWGCKIIKLKWYLAQYTYRSVLGKRPWALMPACVLTQDQNPIHLHRSCYSGPLKCGTQALTRDTTVLLKNWEWPVTVDEARSGINIGLGCSPAVWRLLQGQWVAFLFQRFYSSCRHRQHGRPELSP